MDNFHSSLARMRKEIIDCLKSVQFTSLDAHVPHEQIIPSASYAPWRNDSVFLETYQTIKDSTLVDIYRCYGLWDLIKRHRHLEGHILEVGVWRGGTGCLMAKAIELYSHGKIYLADTFSGTVKGSSKDTKYCRDGVHADTTVGLVNGLIDRLRCQNVTLLQGIFPDEVSLDSAAQIKLCHIDVDSHDSGRDVFEHVWPKIVRGGVVVFDDYGFWGCEGITKLCDNIAVNDAVFIHNLNGHGTFIKL